MKITGRTVKPGEHILLQGASGAGKSTLLKLIAGLLPPAAGQICINGIPARLLDKADRAASLSFITQHATLFDRSLLENTLYGCQNANARQAAKVLAALGLAHLQRQKEHPAESAGDIQATISETAWLNIFVGKNGLSLSGGERQRVLLARAILRRRPIMLLDEAASALDAESEKNVFSVLHQFCPEATIIAVSHHPHNALAGYRTVPIAPPAEAGLPGSESCGKTEAEIRQKPLSCSI